MITASNHGADQTLLHRLPHGRPHPESVPRPCTDIVPPHVPYSGQGYQNLARFGLDPASLKRVGVAPHIVGRLYRTLQANAKVVVRVVGGVEQEEGARVWYLCSGHYCTFGGPFYTTMPSWPSLEPTVSFCPPSPPLLCFRNN